MAKIEQYSAQVDAPGPFQTRSANEADTGYVGKSIQELGNTGQAVGELIEKRVGQAEVSDLGAKYAKLQADGTAALKGAYANPSAPSDDGTTTASKFMDTIDEQLAGITDSATTRLGRNAANKMAATIRKQFETQSDAAEADLAGERAKANHTGMMNGFSNSIFESPSNLESSKMLYAATMDAHVEAGSMTREQQIKFQESDYKLLTESAAKGMINKDPNQALSLLESGGFGKDINADTRFTLISEAKTAIKALDTTAEHADKTLEKAKRDAAEAYFQKSTLKFDKWTDADTKNAQLTLPPNGENSFHQLMAALKNSKEQSDPLVVNDISRRLALPDGDPNKIDSVSQIRQYQAMGKINIPDANRMAGQLDKSTAGKLRNTLLSTFTKQATQQLMPLGATRLDAKGEQMLAGVLVSVHSQLDGKPIGDQTKMLNPNDPTYVGSVLNTLHRDAAQDAREFADSLKSQRSNPGNGEEPVYKMFPSDKNNPSSPAVKYKKVPGGWDKVK